MKSVDKNKEEDPTPYYGLSLAWIDENGEVQTDYHSRVRNPPSPEIEYYWNPKGWMSKLRKISKWAVRYGKKSITVENPDEEYNDLLIESIDEFDPALVEEDDNILPDQIVTNQDLRNQTAYYLGYAKHMMKAHYMYDHKKWWQLWIKRENFPRFPIEREPISQDKDGKIFITREVFKKIIKWDQEIGRKKKSKLF